MNLTDPSSAVGVEVCFTPHRFDPCRWHGPDVSYISGVTVSTVGELPTRSLAALIAPLVKFGKPLAGGGGPPLYQAMYVFTDWLR